MKKSLIALAVLAASGAAMAQSSVTLYGIVDTYLASVKNENNQASRDAGAGTGSITQNVLDSGAVNGSRWGLKGSEDLGGGLKANFDLQQGFDSTTGAAAQRKNILGVKEAAGFNRQAWVGFSGGFGAVRLGNTTTPFDDVSGSSDAVFDSALSPMNSVFKSTGYNARPGNTIYYQAPTFGGFSGAFSYSLGEDKAGAATAAKAAVPATATAAAIAAVPGRTTGATSATSLDLTYAAGPLAVQFAYQVEDTNVTQFAATGDVALSDQKFTRLGASYDFGVAKAKASYGKVNNVGGAANSDATDYQIGVDVPVSAALTLSASYAKSNDSKTGGVFEQSRKGFGLGASYTLSKRTFLYGGVESDTATNNAAADSKHSVYAVGVQHRF